MGAAELGHQHFAALGSRGRALDESEKRPLCHQVEYYFSEKNLPKDNYLRSRMNADGWVQLSEIARFRRVSAYKVTVVELADLLLELSGAVEVDRANSQLRVKDAALRAR